MKCNQENKEGNPTQINVFYFGYIKIFAGFFQRDVSPRNAKTMVFLNGSKRLI